MKMINKAMKGVSFLLCLGFLVSASEVWAKSGISDITSDEMYGSCSDAQQYVAAYNALGNCQDKQAAVTSAQTQLNTVCNVYQSIKAEYKKCTSGEMAASQLAATALTKAQSALKQCQDGLAKQLSNAQSALSSCQKDKKNADKASAKAQETKAKADKANDENAAAQKTAQEAKTAYDAAVATCQKDPNASVCSQLNDLYETYKTTEKKAEKTKAKADKANDKNNAAQNNAASTSLQVNQNNCANGTVYNIALGACSFAADATPEEHAAFNKCDGSISDCIVQAQNDRVAAAKKAQAQKETAAQKAESAKQDYDNAQSAYSQCLNNNNNDISKCAAEEEAMNNAFEASAQAATALGNSGESGTGGVGTSNAEINKLVEDATKPKCSGVSKTGEARGTFGIFDYLACKITTVVADLRTIVYILAGFGMIAFAYSAIIGKINFKQLANIGIGLFILSMTTAIIEEFVFNDGTSHLQYGDFLPNGNHEQYFQNYQGCENNPSLCPDAQLAGMKSAADGSGWSLSDLKASIGSAKDAIRTAAATYNTVKATVDSTIDAVGDIKDAIENGGNIVDIAANVAGSAANIVANASLAASTLGNAASTITNDIRDAGSSAEQRAYRDALQNEYDILKGKCDTGACSEKELAALANLEQQVKDNTTGVDNWLNNDGKGGGATILAGIENVGNIANTASGVATSVEKAQNEGDALGNTLGGGALGDTLGALFAATEAYTAGSDGLDALKSNGSLDFRSQQHKDEDNKAAALAAAQSTCSAQNGTYNAATGACTRADGATIDTTTGAATVKNADGSTTTTLKGQDGSTTTTVTKADGSKVTTTVNPDGSSTTVTNVNGHAVVVTKDASGKTTEATVDGMSTEHQNCITTRGGRWENGKCVGMTKTEEGCGNGQVRYNGTCMSQEQKTAMEAAAKKKADEEACAKKTDYIWDGEQCNPKPKEETIDSNSSENGTIGGKTAEQMKQEIQENSAKANANAKTEQEKCKEQGKVWQKKVGASGAFATDFECVAKNPQQSSCEQKGCIWDANAMGGTGQCKKANGGICF